jgi:hypothetical protein
MTFSYTADFSVQRNRVRLLLGDTDSSAALLQDEELDVFLAGGQLGQANDYLAAVLAGQAVLGKYAHTSTDLSAGGTSVSLSQRVEHLRTMLPVWRAQAAIAVTATPYVGGISAAAKRSREDDSDRVAPAFTRAGGDLRPLDGGPEWEP